MPNTVAMPHGTLDRRRHRRIHVLLVVEIQDDDMPQVARLTELSRTGARLLTARPLPVGAEVNLRRAGVALPARVAWTRGIATGIQFATPLDERDFLRMRRGQRENA